MVKRATVLYILLVLFGCIFGKKGLRNKKNMKKKPSPKISKESCSFDASRSEKRDFEFVGCGVRLLGVFRWLKKPLQNQKEKNIYNPQHTF